jgi:hypothetical protein
MVVADTTELLDEAMIDPVTGEIIDQKDLAERLLAQAKEAGREPGGPGWVAEPTHEERARDGSERCSASPT